MSNIVIVTGDSVDLCGNHQAPDGNNYDFFTNEINITIKDEFSGFLKLYSISDSSYNNGEELFLFSDLCQSKNSSREILHCLDNNNTNTVDNATNDSTKILLDSTLENYTSTLKYGVFNGNYIFDISSSTPIAFLNKDISNLVTYYGNEQNLVNGNAPDGNEYISYKFYHGRVILNVLGDFGNLSYYIKDDTQESGGAYMGGLNSIKFTDFCDDQQSLRATSCLTTTSQFNLISNNGNLVYTLNNDNTFLSNRDYGVHEGIYTLTDICSNYPVAILNNNLEDRIAYGGADEDLCGNFQGPDGNNYDFYQNQIFVSVGDVSFNNLSFYVYHSSSSGYYGLQNKLKFSDLCEDTVSPSDEDVEEVITTSFDQQAS
jgi:hypothetical protein